MQKMTPNADGSLPYKGPIDCAAQTLSKEGPLKFYTGERWRGGGVGVGGQAACSMREPWGAWVPVRMCVH